MKLQVMSHMSEATYSQELKATPRKLSPPFLNIFSQNPTLSFSAFNHIYFKHQSYKQKSYLHVDVTDSVNCYILHL